MSFYVPRVRKIPKNPLVCLFMDACPQDFGDGKSQGN